MGFPAAASGTLVTGGSMANLIGLTVARNQMSGIDLRELGVGALKAPLRFYGSDQIHSCHQKAMEALGLGNRALRRVPSDAACRIDLAALRAAIAARPGGRAAARLRDRHRRHGQHRRHRRPGGDRRPLRRGRAVAACRRLHRRAARHRARRQGAGARDRAGRFHRARPAQMAACALRGRLRAGPGCGRAFRQLHADAGVSRRTRRAASPRARGCTTTACRRRAGSGRSRSGWRSRNMASPSSAA